ncbi:putative transcription factor homeobox-WOX family [Helianthus annuus]|uniref:Homeobox-leucine zipper protein n=1 Tax=Helianthus annuus TaxID=4232 RepID=A0A251RL22_HELAN|nr:homeobox-leucine zipper protein ATHB-7 [Helianthus annuus]KAF5753412.1 putative transcription factor HB-HD-ZIP family [Helianthus annuus]KAJ0427503.1 putative transcription factor homeobox-WOX family [Helianthus annuus]KAJ0445784.1 putative transcription factor homeobox-WOX family [Helianthus annuus]KAJ0630751.1 putative transcription factor homeobox-WOX family [Helianthus annuus]KAJ0634608.1 putative transcription factor homeobox-WOX family [Helianthus annuus]
MSLQQVPTTETTTRKNRNEGRKRFTDKQISFLEYMFETQSRPELRMKHQLAHKLGLHPRQVAIWFQNKRARSKSRQIEQEYNALKHNYETLASKSESLKKENQALLNQLEVLRNVAEKHQEKTSSSGSGEESDDRFTNSPDVMFGQEMNVPFCDGFAYFEEGNSLLEIEEQLPDLQKWWEF